MVAASSSGRRQSNSPVEVADRHRALDDEAAVRLADDAGDGDVVLVGDLADDLLEDVLQGHDAHQAAVLVDDDGEMLAAPAEGLELVEQRRRVRA